MLQEAAGGVARGRVRQWACSTHEQHVINDRIDLTAADAAEQLENRIVALVRRARVPPPAVVHYNHTAMFACRKPNANYRNAIGFRSTEPDGCADI